MTQRENLRLFHDGVSKPSSHLLPLVFCVRPLTLEPLSLVLSHRREPNPALCDLHVLLICGITT